MKNALVIAIMFTVFGASAQQKLIGTNITYYNEIGVVQFIDSSEFTYNSWAGSLFSNEPTFAFVDAVVDWSYELSETTWDVQNVYSGTVQPLTLDETANNTFVNGKLSVSETSTQRYEYQYDGFGNTTNEKYYDYNGSTFVLSFETTYEFDGNNNLILRQFIDHSSGSPLVTSLDSSYYNTAYQLIRFIGYSLNSTTSNLDPITESLITYSGNEVSNIKLYQDLTGSGATEWAYDIFYVYTAGKPTHINAYQVIGGVPQMGAPQVELDFTYGSNAKLATRLVSFAGDATQQIDFVYDAQNFVSEITEHELDMTTSALYVNSIKKFYYQSTVGTEEMEMAEVIVSPNPASDLLSISCDSEIESVAIYAANGALMIVQTTGELNISNLPAGTYIAKVKTASGFAQARFVKG